jgi:predicted secreted protein
MTYTLIIGDDQRQRGPYTARQCREEVDASAGKAKAWGWEEQADGSLIARDYDTLGKLAEAIPDFTTPPKARRNQ